ncbi:MAG: hypothetical protein Kow0020_13310 [Wenzhouxiangellaceae bacterium]
MYRPTGIGWLCAVLLIGSAQAADAPRVAASCPGPVCLEPARFARLLDTASTPALVPPSGLQRSRERADAAVDEVRLNAWLDQLALRGTLAADEREALVRLRDAAPVIWIRHPDHPGYWAPAFAIAARANALLLRDQRLKAVVRMLEDPLALDDAFNAAQSDDDRATLIESAIERGDAAFRQRVDERIAVMAPGRLRDRLRLARARVAPDAAGEVAALVLGAETGIARAALMLAIDRGGAVLQQAAQAAASRPALGGLVVTAHRVSGGDPEQLWTWLESPELGADAARALAEDRPDLLEQVSRRYPIASPLARLRMQLAVRLSGAPDAEALISELTGLAGHRDGSKSVSAAERKR